MTIRYSANAVHDILSASVAATRNLLGLAPELPQDAVRPLLQTAIADMSRLKNRPTLTERQTLEDHQYDLLGNMLLELWDESEEE